MSKGTRWWDYYFVRYFVGTIFGVALILWLQVHGLVCAHAQCEAVPKQPWITATAFGAVGLAFCYLASAPVLTLHALRFRLPRCPRLFDGLAILVALLVAAGGIFLGFSYTSHASQTTPTAAWFIPFFVVILFQVGLLCSRFAIVIRKRYRELAVDRGRADETYLGRNRGQYIESYRHLREHGNAFSILFVELIFALAVAAAPTWLFIGGLIAIWILPATFAWFIGTWLEFGIADV